MKQCLSNKQVKKVSAFLPFGLCKKPDEKKLDPEDSVLLHRNFSKKDMPTSKVEILVKSNNLYCGN